MCVQTVRQKQLVYGDKKYNDLSKTTIINKKKNSRKRWQSYQILDPSVNYY